MLLLLPRGPDEVAVCAKILLGTILPPVPLFQDTFDDGEVVSCAHVELFGLVNVFVVFRSLAIH